MADPAPSAPVPLASHIAAKHQSLRESLSALVMEKIPEGEVCVSEEKLVVRVPRCERALWGQTRFTSFGELTEQVRKMEGTVRVAGAVAKDLERLNPTLNVTGDTRDDSSLPCGWEYVFTFEKR